MGQIIPVGGDEQSQKQILRELQCMDDATHKNIVTFYGGAPSGTAYPHVLFWERGG